MPDFINLQNYIFFATYGYCFRYIEAFLKELTLPPPYSTKKSVAKKRL